MSKVTRCCWFLTFVALAVLSLGTANAALDCTMVLPSSSAPFWPPSVLELEQDTVLCIREGVHRNVSLSIQGNNSFSLWVRPLEGEVTLEHAVQRFLTLKDVANVFIERMQFTHATGEDGSFIFATDTALLSLLEVTVKGCSVAGQGGSVYCVDCHHVLVRNSVFEGGLQEVLNDEGDVVYLSAGMGGIFALFYSKGNGQSLVFENSTLSSGVANLGGAVAIFSNCDVACVNNMTVTVNDTVVEGFTALEIGAAFLTEFAGGLSGNGFRFSMFGSSAIRNVSAASGAGLYFMWYYSSTKDNVCSILLADNASISGCSSTKHTTENAGGAISLVFPLLQLSTRGSFDVSLSLAGSASIHDCFSEFGGGALFVEGNIRRGSFSLFDQASIRNCTSASSGGALYLSLSPSDNPPSFAITLRDQATLSSCKALVGGAVYVQMNTIILAVPFKMIPVVTLSVEGAATIENCAASYGGALSVQGVSAVLQLRNAAVRGLVAASRGALVEYSSNGMAATFALIIEGSVITECVGNLVFVESATTDSNATQRTFQANISSTVVSSIAIGNTNALFSGVHTTDAAVTCVGAIFSGIEINRAYSKVVTLADASGLFRFLDAAGMRLQLTRCRFERITMSNTAKGALFFSSTMLNLALDRCTIADVLFSDVGQGGVVLVPSSSSVYLFNSSISVTIASDFVGNVFSMVSQFPGTALSGGPLFIFGCSFEISSQGVFGQVVLLSSFPSCRFVSTTNSSTYSLLHGIGEAREHMLFLPLQWVTLGMKLLASAPWPPLSHNDNTTGPYFADDDFADMNVDDDYVPAIGDVILSSPLAPWGLAYERTLDPLFRTLNALDRTEWKCPAGFNIEMDVENSLLSEPSFHDGCTPNGKGPNACEFLSFPIEIMCVPCPEGSFSPASGWTTSTALSTIVCLTCGSGTVCPGQGTMSIMRGFWGSPRLAEAKGVPLSSTDGLVVRCPTGYCCMPPNGSQTCPLYVSGRLTGLTESGLCQNYRNGTLCGSCRRGFSFAVIGDGCVPEVDDNVRLPLVLGLISAACLVYVLAQTHRSLKRTRASLQLVTYFFSTVVLVYEPLGFGPSSWEGALVSAIASVFNGFDLSSHKRLPVNDTVSPSQAFSGLMGAEAFLDAPLWSSASGTDKILMGLFPAAVMISCLVLLLAVGAIVQRAAKSSTRKGRMALLEKEVKATTTLNTVASQKELNRCAQWWSLSFTQGSTALYNILLFTYGSLLTSTLKLLSCTSLLDPVTGEVKRVRFFAGDQLCWTTSDARVIVIGVSSLIVLIALPLLLVVLHSVVVYRRKKGYPDRIWMVRVNAVISYLESPYKARFWWYESFLIVRRLVLGITATRLMDYPVSRSMGFVAELATFLCIDGALMPFRSAEDQAVVVTLQVVLILLAVLPLGSAMLNSLEVSFDLTPIREGLFDELFAWQVVLILLGFVYTVFVLVRVVYEAFQSWKRQRNGGKLRCCSSRFPRRCMLQSCCSRQRQRESMKEELNYFPVGSSYTY